MRFTGLDRFAGTSLDNSLPKPGEGLQMVRNCWYSSLGSIQYARLFMGSPRDPAWAPSRRPPNRPLGTLMVFPVFGAIGCTIEGRPVTVSRGSLIVMPPGEYEPIACLDEPCVYGVIETRPVDQVPKRRKSRFVAKGIPLDPLDATRGLLQRRQLLRPRQAAGVNAASHYVLGSGGQIHPIPATGITLVVCLQGELDVTCYKGGRSATRTVRPGARVVVSPAYRFGMRNITPGGQRASVLLLSFRATSNAR